MFVFGGLGGVVELLSLSVTLRLLRDKDGPAGVLTQLDCSGYSASCQDCQHSVHTAQCIHSMCAQIHKQKLTYASTLKKHSGLDVRKD